MEQNTHGERHDSGPVAAHDAAGPEVAANDLTGEEGMATAEYAVATLAAVGLAGLLIVVLKSEMVRGLLEGLIKTALSVG